MNDSTISNAAEKIRLVKYAILQTTIGPSIVCDLLVFLYFIRHWKKEILKAPQNHVILCLLIASFIQKNTDIIFHLYFLRWGVVLRQSYDFCVIWNWLNYSLYCVNLHLVTWCCLERHLFVFHSQLMKKKWCLIIFHYIPLVVCSLYTPSLYIYLIFLPTMCTNVWDYTTVYCGGACYAFADPSLGTFDWIFHNGVPALLILFSNLILFCRIIWQKIRLTRSVHWRQQKRLIIQLAFISSLFMILGFPAVIVGSVQILWIPTFLSDIQYNYLYYTGVFINQFLPFAIVSSLPKMRQELKGWIENVRRRISGQVQVQPALTMTVVGGNNGTIGATR